MEDSAQPWHENRNRARSFGRALFGSSLLMGIVLALGTSAFGIFIGHMVAQPRVAPMMAVLSLSIVFLVLAVPANARLARRKNLGFGAAAELAANLSGAGVAIILGLKGAGAWSLVAQYLTVFAVRAADFERRFIQFTDVRI